MMLKCLKQIEQQYYTNFVTLVRQWLGADCWLMIPTTQRRGNAYVKGVIESFSYTRKKICFLNFLVICCFISSSITVSYLNKTSKDNQRKSRWRQRIHNILFSCTGLQCTSLTKTSNYHERRQRVSGRF